MQWKRMRGGSAAGWARRCWPLIGILTLALALRLHGVSFGLPGLYDPDELMFELGALRMLRTGTLNPGWFGHPATVTMYGLAIVDVAVFLFGHARGWFDTVADFARAVWIDPGLIVLPARILMALFGVATVAMAARIGDRLFGRSAGIAAALLVAFDPVHIAWSQVVRSDMMACFFMLCCIDMAVSYRRRGHRADLVRGALALALAIACKWPFGLAALAFGGAAVLRWRAGEERAAAALGRFATFLVASALLLVVIAPYLAIEHAAVLRDLNGEAQSHHLGATGGTLWWNIRWYIAGPLVSGLGFFGLGLMLAGTWLSLKRAEAGAILLPLLAVFLAVFGFQHLVWERWALPLLLIGAILAGAGAAALFDAVARHWPRAGKPGVGAALAVLALAPLAVSANQRTHERLHDTRSLASRWAAAHIPAGSTVMIEHFAFDLYPQPWRLLFPLGDAGCIDAKAMLHGKISYAPIAAGRGARANVDYGTMAPGMRPTCRSDFAILSQYDRYAAERQNFPVEYSAYRQLLGQGVVVANFVPRPGESGGPAIRIVSFGKSAVKQANTAHELAGGASLLRARTVPERSTYSDGRSY